MQENEIEKTEIISTSTCIDVLFLLNKNIISKKKLTKSKNYFVLVYKSITTIRTIKYF